MAKFMCLEHTVLNRVAPDGQKYCDLIMAGQILDEPELPNHHFVPLDREVQGKTVEDVLRDKLKVMGVYINKEMDVNTLQKLLAEKRMEDIETIDTVVMKKVLDDHGIKYHHKLGGKKLLKLIRQNDLGNEYKEARKLKAEE
jgi:hypothetical protein